MIRTVPADPQSHRGEKFITAAAILLFAVLLVRSTGNESATYDEPLHIASSLAIRQRGDYRVDPEDPALFKRWLTIGEPTVPLPTASPFWPTAGIDPPSQWAWAVQAVFDRPAGEALALVDHARWRMMAVSLALLCVIGMWAWQIGGPLAGSLAMAIAAIEPNLLANGGIAKNDSLATLGFTLVAIALWKIGERITPARVLALAAAVAMTASVKFSGVLLGGIVPTVLGVRALVPIGWNRRWRRDEAIAERGISDSRESDTSSLISTPEQSILTRLLLAAAICIACLLCTAFVIWAAYGFRYAPSPDASFHFNLAEQASDHAWLMTIDRLRLLPQAFTFGLAYTLHSAAARDSFLLGQLSSTGWWYYFPIAIAVKLPTAFLLAAIGCAGWMISPAGKRAVDRRGWTIVCLILPPAIYLAAAMHSSLNIGFRHVLPILPPMMVAMAVLLARWPRVAISVIVLMLIEVAPMWNRPLTFFNLAGRTYGERRILADSNLDWGQGLIALADWQADHRDDRLFLDYFGTADPAAYGVNYTNAFAGYAFGFPPIRPRTPGVLAVSVTHLQGLYVPADLRPFYAELRGRKPREIVGGCIYLFDWPTSQEQKY